MEESTSCTRRVFLGIVLCERERRTNDTSREQEGEN